MNLSRTLTAAAVAAVSLALSASTLAPAQASAPTVAKKKHGVTATVSSTEVVQDDDVVIKGTVTRAAKGERVVLEIRYAGGSWQRSKVTDRLDRKGRFTLTDTVGSGRSRDYRVLAPTTGRVKAGRSKRLPVTVYSWRNLTSYDAVRNDATYELGDVRMNGVLYPSSIGGSLAAAGGTDYNLERRCRELTTAVGIRDTAPNGATGTAYLRTDGTQQFTGTYALTQTASITLPLTDVFRISFDWTATDGAEVALGSPRVLCRD